MSHLESGSVVWVRLGQAWWPGTITTVAKCPPEFVQGIRKTPIAIVKFFHENEYQDVHKSEHIQPYNCDRKEEFIRKGQSVNKNQSHGDVDLLAKFESDVVTAEKLTGGDMDILHTLEEGADTYKTFHHTYCPPMSLGLDSNITVISGRPSQPPPASPCPAGVEFEPRPQENLWPERVEAHTHVDCNTSKVRNPLSCQETSSDHQIASLSREQSSAAALVGGESQDKPHLQTSLVANYCSSGEEEEELGSSGYLGKMSPSPNINKFFKSHEKGTTKKAKDISRAASLALSLITGEADPLSLLPGVGEEDEEGEGEGEGESLEDDDEDSLNLELESGSDKFEESLDEDSLNLELETDEEDDQDLCQLDDESQNDETLETESDADDPLLDEEDESSLTPPEPEQERLGEAPDEDSLIPDFETESDSEGNLGEEDPPHLPATWDSDDEYDSEDELYRNLPSASGTDDDTANEPEELFTGVVENTCQPETQISPDTPGAEGESNPSRDQPVMQAAEEVLNVSKMEKSLQTEDKSNSNMSSRDDAEIAKCESLGDVSCPSSTSFQGPLNHQNAENRNGKKEMKGKECIKEETGSLMPQSPSLSGQSEVPITSSTLEEHEEHQHHQALEEPASCSDGDRISIPRESDEHENTESTLSNTDGDESQKLSVPSTAVPLQPVSSLDTPSTSKSVREDGLSITLSESLLNFEGFDWERTSKAGAHLQMLLRVRQRITCPSTSRRAKAWKVKTVKKERKKRGRPPLRGHVRKLRGKRKPVAASFMRRSSRVASNTSDTDSGSWDEPGTVHQRVSGARQARGSGTLRKQKSFRARRSTREQRHAAPRRNMRRRQATDTEKSVEKRRTRRSDKEIEEEVVEKQKSDKTRSRAKELLRRMSHSPDITTSEGFTRHERVRGGAAWGSNMEDSQSHTPAKRPRKRKPSEVDNLLMWAVESGHTGSRSRGVRERHESPSQTPGTTDTATSITITTPVTTTTTTTTVTATTATHLNTRRPRLEQKTAKKEMKKRGRKRKPRTDTEAEEEGNEEETASDKQNYHPSSSEDTGNNSEEEAQGKGRLGIPYKCGEVVWAQQEGRWWPSYVDQLYPQTRRVSVYCVGQKQEASVKVDLAKIKTFQYGEVPAFVDRSESGFMEALQVTESFCLLRNHGNKVSAHKFFTMPPEEQDALIIVSFTPKDDPALTAPRGKRTRGQGKGESPPKAQKGWHYERLNSDSESEARSRAEDKYEMTARDHRRMKKALRSRRRENEKLMKYMNSAACMEHLWQIFTGQKQCERHKLYQSEVTRRSLLWSGIGPFQLDQDDDQILSVVDFLHTEMNKKQPDFNLAQDYVFKVWMPEAIKEALRVVLKVPEDMLELALDEGYRESLSERRSRRLDFV